MIDSEQVPRGKGEKTPCEGCEIEPETLCLHRPRGCRKATDRVLIGERTNELAVQCEVKGAIPEAVVKARMNSPISIAH